MFWNKTIKRINRRLNLHNNALIDINHDLAEAFKTLSAVIPDLMRRVEALEAKKQNKKTTKKTTKKTKGK